MNVMQRSCTLAALALLMPSAPLLAGPSLNAKPLPESRSFFITNLSYSYRVTPPATVGYTYSGYTSSSQPSGRHLITSELGIMHNRNPRYAVGFSECTLWDVADHLHVGLNVRGRRWVDREKSVDVTAGALLWGTNGDEYNYPGFVGTASMNFNDWENLHLTVTALPVRFNSLSPQETEFGAFLGYGIAGKPGFVTTVVAGLAFGLLVAAFVASGGYE